MAIYDLGPEPGPSALEMKYRRLLRLLPAGYRAIREEEMADVFLRERIDTDPENADLTLTFGAPGLAESWSIVLLAIRARLATAPQRTQTRLQAVRTATLGGLVVLSVQATNILLTRFLVSNFPQYVGFTASGSAATGWAAVQEWLPVLWIAVLAAVLFGRPLAGRLIAATSIVAALVMPVMSGLPRAASWLVLIVEVGLVAGIGAFDPKTPPPRRGLWIITATAGIIAVSAMSVIGWLLPPTRYPIGRIFANVLGTGAGFWCLAAIAAAFTLLTLRSLRIAIPTGVILGVSALSTTALLIRAESLITWLSLPPGSGAEDAITPAAVQLIAVAAIALTTAIIGTVRYLHLPPPSKSPRSGSHLPESHSDPDPPSSTR